MNNKFIVFLFGIVILVLGLIGGYVGATTSEAQQIAAVKKIVPTANPVMALNGTIQNITDNSITLQISSIPLSVYPVVDDFPLIRTISIGSNTKIMLITQKSPAEIQSEALAYQQEIQKLSAPGTTSTLPITSIPPSPFDETSTTLSALKTGDIITVAASSDIMSAPSFSATEVDVQGSLAH